MWRDVVEKAVERIEIWCQCKCCMTPSCYKYIKESSHHDKTKHIEVDQHFISEKIEEKIIDLSYVQCPVKDADCRHPPTQFSLHFYNRMISPLFSTVFFNLSMAWEVENRSWILKHPLLALAHLPLIPVAAVKLPHQIEVCNLPLIPFTTHPFK